MRIRSSEMGSKWKDSKCRCNSLTKIGQCVSHESACVCVVLFNVFSTTSIKTIVALDGCPNYWSEAVVLS